MTTIERLWALLDANANPDPTHPDPDSIWIDLADSAIVALPALLAVAEAARLVIRTPDGLLSRAWINCIGEYEARELLANLNDALARLDGAS